MLRIVSLIASATEIVHALGLGRFQVGRSHECDYPGSVLALPVCTRPSFAVDGDSATIDRLVKEKMQAAASVYQICGDVLRELAPTHLITQTQCRVCAVSLQDVERELCRPLSTRPRVVALEPNSLNDIWGDILRVAEACGVASAGRELVDSLQAGVNRISSLAARPAARPRVACVEWMEPLMAAGNWIPELIELAGGHNLFTRAGVHSPWLDWEDVRAADPDVIVVSPCGFGLDRVRSEMHWLTDRPGWTALAAVRARRVFLVDGNQYMTRPGPRVVESLQILAGILHPDRFPQEDFADSARVCRFMS
jgi:iron complex transport system substrate-binding protein